MNWLNRKGKFRRTQKKKRELKNKQYSNNQVLFRMKARDKWKNNLNYREYSKQFKAKPEIRLHGNISPFIRTALKEKKDGKMGIYCWLFKRI